jgi:hypothetical protein
MNEIVEPTIDYDFSSILFGPPTGLAGGNYFAKLINRNKSLFIQTPKCLTKQGFVKSGKKTYVDLMFDNNDTIFVDWIENLVSRCQDLVFSKRESWFQSSLERDDIESAFTSPFKIFKSGKFYLLRVNVKPNVKIYDEEDKIIPLESVTTEKYLISIIEISGLRFSTKSFQLEFDLKQSMVVSPDPFLDECFIKKPILNKKTDSSSLENIISNSLNDLVEKKEVKIQEVEKITKEEDYENEKENYVEELKEQKEEELNNDILEIIDLEEAFDSPFQEETLTLKKPNEVYHELYTTLKGKAKEAKKQAIQCYLELQKIKQTYLINAEESDEEFDEYISHLHETNTLEKYV